MQNPKSIPTQGGVRYRYLSFVCQDNQPRKRPIRSSGGGLPRVGGIRKNLNLTQAQFGKMIGLSGQHIGKIEKGQHGVSVDTISKICHATNVSADYILFGVNYTTVYPISPAVDGLSQEQMQILFDIIKKFVQFVNTEDGNEVLIREVGRQQRMRVRNAVCNP